MKIGWFDGNAGASGDMMLAALASAGVPVEVMQANLDRFDLGIELRAEPVQRAGLGAIKMHVDVPESITYRHLPDIIELLGALPDPVRLLASDVFDKLAHAEAAVHQVSVDQVHFHEVGALDSIADIVGVATGVNFLQLDEWHCSTLSLGSGQTRGAHGPIPVPAPAVLALLSGVGLVQAGPAAYESTTPTGAALLATLVSEWGPLPTMAIETVGMGAGTKDTPDVANIVRLVIGTAAS